MLESCSEWNVTKKHGMYSENLYECHFWESEECTDQYSYEHKIKIQNLYCDPKIRWEISSKDNIESEEWCNEEITYSIAIKGDNFDVDILSNGGVELIIDGGYNLRALLIGLIDKLDHANKRISSRIYNENVVKS